MPRATVWMVCSAIAVQLVACATSGSPEPVVVQFSYDAVNPASAQIPENGNVTWVSLATDTRGFVVFPASIAAGFTCGGDLRPYFRRTQGGYRSLPLTSLESERVELPCPLRPGVYPYEIWIFGAGLGETTADTVPQRKLSGKIVVE